MSHSLPFELFEELPEEELPFELLELFFVSSDELLRLPPEDWPP